MISKTMQIVFVYKLNTLSLMRLEAMFGTQTNVGLQVVQNGIYILASRELYRFWSSNNIILL